MQAATAANIRRSETRDCRCESKKEVTPNASLFTGAPGIRKYLACDTTLAAVKAKAGCLNSRGMTKRLGTFGKASVRAIIEGTHLSYDVRVGAHIERSTDNFCTLQPSP